VEGHAYEQAVTTGAVLRTALDEAARWPCHSHGMPILPVSHARVWQTVA